MKKRIITGIIALTMLAAISGCGKAASFESIKAAKKVVTLGDYKGLEMTIEEVTQAEVDAYIETNLLSNGNNYQEVKEGLVKEGDLVNINYLGKKDDVPFDGGSNMEDAAGYNLEIGSNSFIPGFEAGLIGVSVGDTVDIDLTFPEDYENEELNGQAVVFTVTVNYICGDKIIPELSDDFVASNTNYSNVADYKGFVNETLLNNNKLKAENDIWNTAISNAEISEYPQNEIDAALETIRNYYTNLAGYYNAELGEVLSSMGSSEETFNEDMLPYAQQSVSNKLVALAIVDKEKIKLTDKMYEEKLEEYMTEYGLSSVEELKEGIEEEQIKEQMYIDLGRQYVIDHAATQ